MKRERIMITSDRLTVEIDPLGANLTSICETAVSGEKIEYLWQGDKRYWAGQAPNLFPYIARMTDGRYSLNGKEYEMNIHGFAKDSLFDLVCLKKTEAVFSLKDNMETYRQYPYRFEFTVCYHLWKNRIDITLRVKNMDEKEMYFGIGGHPGFNVPIEKGFSFEDYVLEFSDECRPKRIGFSSDCFVEGTPSVFTLEDNRRIAMSHELFDQDAIVLTEVGKQVTLKARNGGRMVRVTYPNMDYLGIWHTPNTDAPYVCIEPWSSLPSRKGIVEDLARQPGLVCLAAKEEYVNTWSIEVDELRNVYEDVMECVV